MRKGTPLQAVKYARTLHAVDCVDFLKDWVDGNLETWNLVGERRHSPIASFDVFCRDNPDEPARADGRKLHYGDGRQPLDDIVDAGWGPGFACGHILKYLRRTKTPERDLEAARWYWNFVRKKALIECLPDWFHSYRHLRTLLTEDEIEKLEAA